VLQRNNKANDVKTIKFHGTKDKLIPLKGLAMRIEGVGHFMIVDKANEVNIKVNQEVIIFEKLDTIRSWRKTKDISPS